MFQVNEYKIVFKRVWHNRRRSTSKDLRESKSYKATDNDGRYDTKCEIYIKDLEVPRFTGIARLHPNDTPDRIVGKKIALQNALGKYYPKCDAIIYSCANFYNKEVRTAIWKAFWGWVADWKWVHP